MSTNEPLDLAAVEARLHLNDDFPNAFKYSKIGQEMQAILAHCRALRAALDGLLQAVKNGPYIDGWPVSEWLEPIEVTAQAAAVLAQAIDGEAT